MDNNSAVIKLPFWETVRRSFMYVLTNMDVYLKVSALGFAILIYEMFTGFPSLCNINETGCSGGWQQNVSIVLLSLVSIAVVIAYCRVMVLKSPTNYFSLAFGRRELLYLLYNILIIAIITLPSLLAIFVFAYLGQMLHFPETVFNLAVLIPLAFTIYFSRLFLVLPAVAVDNKELRLKKSFELARGNANKIFWGQFLMMIPAAAVLVLLALVYRIIGTESYVINTVFVVLVLALSFLDSCFKASFYAHIYQYFTFYSAKTSIAE